MTALAPTSSSRILIVDDEPMNVRLLERILTEAGYRELRSTTDPRRVVSLYEAFDPDLVLLDLLMPHLDGVAVMEQLRIAPDVFMPVLVLTADVTAEAKQRALAAGAKDFLTKPFDRLEVLLRIKNLLDTRHLYLEQQRHRHGLEQLVRERTQQLLQTEKLATMGSLLAGVAHELNNPLAILLGYAHLLHDMTQDPGILDRAEKISSAARRCARIVKNFLALARQCPPEHGIVHLYAVIQEAVELLAYQLRTESVDVKLDLPDALPTFWADGHQLHQVFVNLIANAHQAMSGRPGAREIEIATRLDADRRRVVIEVTDTGPGIPREIQPRIFEAFFTTRTKGEGTGLGLSLCREIIEAHGGTITVHSEPGHGATFVIELPLATSPSPDGGEGTGAEVLPAAGPQRVLVVEDEVEIAAMLAEVLRLDEHTVEMAPNGAVALRMLDGRSYDLIMTDTKMPVLDGEGFYRELVRRDPALGARIIFLTGDVMSSEKRRFLDSTGAPVLVKPFMPRDVRQVVCRMAGIGRGLHGDQHPGHTSPSR